MVTFVYFDILTGLFLLFKNIWFSSFYSEFEYNTGIIEVRVESNIT